MFARLSARSRDAKFRLLQTLAATGPTNTVLDLGGQVDSAAPLRSLFPHASITVVNLDRGHVERCVQELGIPGIVADGSRLPFADGAFDLVYCNAVIEHLGSESSQRKIAAEIQRVGRRWFVATPNRWFPFEFHTRLPFVSWLPPAALHKCAAILSYNHPQHRYTRGNDQTDLRLLGAQQLRALFPTSSILRNRITIWPETLIAHGVHVDSARLSGQGRCDTGEPMPVTHSAQTINIRKGRANGRSVPRG